MGIDESKRKDSERDGALLNSHDLVLPSYYRALAAFVGFFRNVSWSHGPVEKLNTLTLYRDEHVPRIVTCRSSFLC